MARAASVVIAVLAGIGCTNQSTPRTGAAGGAVPGAPVVIVTIDTLRADRLPAYGYRGVETPSLDAFRRDSVLFENAYSHCPLTLPAHVSLLTGLLPPQHGVRNNLGYRFDSKAHPSLASRLKDAGYGTAAAVSAWVLRKETGLGASFDRYDEVGGRAEASVAELQRPGTQTVAAALEFVRARQGRPFFLFVHLYEPHVPYAPPEPERTRWGATYEGEIAAADAALGELVAGLKTERVYEGALMVVTSDHGEGLGDHGEDEHGILLYRESLHVPLMVKRPHRSGAGESVARTVGLVDVVPTVTASLGLETPAGLAGRSLFAPAGPGAVYAETYYPRIHLGWSELHALIDDRFHLIDGPRPELYDVRRDPAERTDLAGPRSSTVTAMRQELSTRRGDYRVPEAVGAEQREKLQALGYLAGGGAAESERAGARANPRDRIGARGEMKAAAGLAAQGKHDDAARALRALLSREPSFFDAQWELGRTLARAGRLDEAARAYRQAMALSPALAPSVALALAEVELARGDLREAAAAAALVSGDIGEEARGAAVRAEVDARQGRFDEAIERARAAEALLATREAAPVRGLAFVRGDALARLGRHQEAELALREEIRRFPSEVRAYASLAVVVALQGRRDEVPGILEAMQRGRPGPETAAMAARTLAFLDGGGEGSTHRREPTPPFAGGSR